MPRSYRNSRALTRIFFLLVIAAGLLGWQYGRSYWQPDISTFELLSLSDDTDWIDIITGLLEDTIQIFQDITGS